MIQVKKLNPKMKKTQNPVQKNFLNGSRIVRICVLNLTEGAKIRFNIRLFEDLGMEEAFLRRQNCRALTTDVRSAHPS